MGPLLAPVLALAGAIVAAAKSGAPLFVHVSDVESGRTPPMDLDLGERVTFRAGGNTYYGTIVNWDCSGPACWNDVRIDDGPQPIDVGRVIRLNDDQLARLSGVIGRGLGGVVDDMQAMPLYVKATAALAIAGVGAAVLYGGATPKRAR